MSKPREYIGINPGGNSNALISVLKPDDFNALRGLSDHPEKIYLIEKSAYDALEARVKELESILPRAIRLAEELEAESFLTEEDQEWLAKVRKLKQETEDASIVKRCEPSQAV